VSAHLLPWKCHARDEAGRRFDRQAAGIGCRGELGAAAADASDAQFLGDVPDTETPDFAACSMKWRLSLSHLRSFAAGRGAFPNIHNPKTLWIGIEDGGEDLKQLAGAIDEALKTKLGYAREHRGFHPHLTIGRVKREHPDGEGELSRLLAEQAHFDADLVIVDEVVAFASFFRPAGTGS